MVLCVTTLPKTAHFSKTLWLLGCVLANIAYGFYSSLLIRVCKHYEGGSTGVSIAASGVREQILHGVLDETCVGPSFHLIHPYFGPQSVVFFLITLLTDGLLVWKCYAPASGDLTYYDVSWVTGNISIGLSVALTVGLFMPPEHQEFRAILFPLQLGTSVFLNTLITSTIVTLLFRHRRMLILVFGSDQHLPMTILTESAALIVSFGVAVIVSVSALRSAGETVSQVHIFVQPIAWLLTIYRVSRDSDYFSQGREGAFAISAVNFTKCTSSNVPPTSEYRAFT